MKANRNMLIQFHTEYTSITDELENVCHMIASPTVSLRDSNDKPKNYNELTRAEMAALQEHEHLKECEENDYMMLSNLIHNRASGNEDSFEGSSPQDNTNRRMLRRETAIELPITPSKSNQTGIGDSAADKDEFPYPNINSRNLSADQGLNRKMATVNYLIPSMSDPQPKLYQKSCDSLQKNSSTDTEYSMLPYKVIKQSSNETNTSLTGSFNVENASFNLDLSMDTENSPNVTVIENSAVNVDNKLLPIAPKTTTFGGVEIRHASIDCARSGSIMLKKQFSIDQTSSKGTTADTADGSPKVATFQKSCLKPPTGSPAMKMASAALKESSSTSTDESKDDRSIPVINTDVVQDEIAKLSSNINSSTEEKNDQSFNETMC